TGFGTSRICTTSGGPYRSQTAAYIADQATASQHGTAAPCTAVGPAPGMDTVGFGSEVTGVAVFVAGVGNLGRSLTALPVPVPHGELRVRGPYRSVRPLSAPADPTPGPAPHHH